MKKDTYVSIDIEADGRMPGTSSMLSFAAAAFTIDKKLLGTFSRNLDLLPPPAAPDPETDKFWSDNPVAWFATRENTVDPELAMTDFETWINGLPGVPIFTGYPVVYDAKWIEYYFRRFCGRYPFGHSRHIDVKVFAWSMLGGEFHTTSKRKMPRHWFDDLPHTHVAEDDAIEQGALFVNMLREARGLPAIKEIER